MPSFLCLSFGSRSKNSTADNATLDGSGWQTIGSRHLPDGAGFGPPPAYSLHPTTHSGATLAGNTIDPASEGSPGKEPSQANSEKRTLGEAAEESFEEEATDQGQSSSALKPGFAHERFLDKWFKCKDSGDRQILLMGCFEILPRACREDINASCRFAVLKWDAIEQNTVGTVLVVLKCLRESEASAVGNSRYWYLPHDEIVSLVQEAFKVSQADIKAQSRRLFEENLPLVLRRQIAPVI
jgi:hypothetical protein